MHNTDVKHVILIKLNFSFNSEYLILYNINNFPVLKPRKLVVKIHSAQLILQEISKQKRASPFLPVWYVPNE